jgi:hypothetical protein
MSGVATHDLISVWFQVYRSSLRIDDDIANLGLNITPTVVFTKAFLINLELHFNILDWKDFKLFYMMLVECLLELVTKDLENKQYVTNTCRPHLNTFFNVNTKVKLTFKLIKKWEREREITHHNMILTFTVENE